MEVYLDNSATTRQYDRVTDAMAQAMRETYGNPSSLHSLGVAAEKKVRQARKALASAFGASEDEIYFTSGGTVISEEKGIKLEQATIEMLGTAETVNVNKDNTTIVNGAGNKEAIAARVAQIKAQIAATKSTYDKEKLQERLAKLAGGVAQLNVGAASEVEMKEKKDRVDDALSATRAAIEEGIVPGGGVMYIRAQAALDGLKGANEDEQTGIEIVRRAIEEPLRP